MIPAPVRHTFLLFFGIAIALSCSSFASRAQTVEDTVAFVVAGVEDGGTMGNFKFKQAANGKFETQGARGANFFVVKQQEKCVFSFQLAGPDFHGPGSEATLLNFNTGWNASSDESDFTLYGKGIWCPSLTDPSKCTDAAPLGKLSIDKNRWLKAVTYLKETFCKGKAF